MDAQKLAKKEIRKKNVEEDRPKRPKKPDVMVFKPSEHSHKHGPLVPITNTKEEILQIIRDSGGFVTQIADAMKISPVRVRTLIRKTKEYQDAMFEAREESLDITEAKLMEKVEEGNLLAIMFKLKCHGQERGFIDTPQKKTGSSEEKPLYIKILPIGQEDAPRKVGRPKKDFAEIKIIPEKTKAIVAIPDENVYEGELVANA
jgi:hypothetical protein